ncbi:hypothetical protein E2562_003610 [Oryza meyeriana var. granulata]|uniref:Transposase (putative) gypsy type domain-containing protein n=1 Tax=Oryza meyeriana var. granulata TaxID=110450 RepID=A0A6G1CNC5_9ORYZ|nr:hypothetical protein E2562_003610 [Oryza meyeriana var. granulata]
MPSSPSPCSSSSWSPPAAARSPSTSDDDGARALTVAERSISTLRTRDMLGDIRRRCSIPRRFTALLAGDLPACAPPPPGVAVVYVAAMENGQMRLPLQPFFAAVLAHFGLAPSQLTPNAWRLLSGFVVLCRRAGVAQPSLAVFRHFFVVCGCPPGAWYSFRGRSSAGELFARLHDVKMNAWKEHFFLVWSPAPWPCPVRWGKPCKYPTLPPVLSSKEKDMAAKLLRARGSSLIDLTTAAKYASVNAMMKALRPEKAPMAAAAEEADVKSEPDLDRPECAPSSGKKRKTEEDDVVAEDGPSDHVGGGWLSLYPACPPPPGFKKLDDDGHKGGWKAARRLLQGIVTASRGREFAAAKPADIVAASYVAMLQAANHVAFSLGYALELEDKLRARERDAGAEELAEVAEMETAAEATRAKHAEAKSASAAAAVQLERGPWDAGCTRARSRRTRRRGRSTEWRT